MTDMKWTALRPYQDGNMDVLDQDGMCVAACLPEEYANLVAAAPEMRRALELIIEQTPVAEWLEDDEFHCVYQAMHKADGDL